MRRRAFLAAAAVVPRATGVLEAVREAARPGQIKRVPAREFIAIPK